MLKFNKDSIVVKSWVTMVMAGVYTIEEVPTIFGIREAVEAVLKELQEA